MIKKCRYCGKEFEANSNRQVYCKGPHYYNCVVCGKQTEVTNRRILSEGPCACSQSCKQVLIQSTSMKKYGIATPGNSKKAREKSKKTMIARYGVPYAMMSKEVMERSKKTNLERYGVDHYVESEDFKKKRKKESIYLLNLSVAQEFFKEWGIDVADVEETSFFGIVQGDKIRCAIQLTYDSKYNCVRIEGIAKASCYEIKRKDRNLDIDKLIDFLYQSYYYDMFVLSDKIKYSDEIRLLTEKYESLACQNIDDSVLLIIQ